MYLFLNFDRSRFLQWIDEPIDGITRLEKNLFVEIRLKKYIESYVCVQSCRQIVFFMRNCVLFDVEGIKHESIVSSHDNDYPCMHHQKRIDYLLPIGRSY